MRNFYKLLSLVFSIGVTVSAFAQVESDIVITEIFYNQPGNDTLEFIEITNKGASGINLNGYRFTKGITYQFSNVTINPGEYMVISKSSSMISSFFGKSSFQWDAGTSLSNTGEEIILKDQNGNIADSVDYSDGLPFDTTADGDGPSLILCNPNLDNAYGYNWAANQTSAGSFSGDPIFATPGTANSGCQDRMGPKPEKAKAISLNQIRVVFNEPVDASAENTGNYSGMSISNASRNQKNDTVILTLSSNLTAGNMYTITVSGVKDLAGNVMGKAKNFQIIYNNTIGNLVITEILYDDPSLEDSLEFIEVINNGSSAVNVGGYSFDKGIDFDFPSITMNPGDIMVIAENADAINAVFGISNVQEWKKSSLSNTGEKISIINSAKDLIDSLTYRTDNSWPTQAAVNGSSIAICNPSSDNSIGTNWGVSGGGISRMINGTIIYANPGSIGACIQSNTSAIQGSIKVFPVPAKDIVEITFEEKGKRKIELVSSTGEIVYTEETEENGIEIEKKINGLYLLKITDLSQQKSQVTKVLFE